MVGAVDVCLDSVNPATGFRMDPYPAGYMGKTPARLGLGSRKVMECGNSKMVTIPPDILDAMDIEGGDEVELVYDRQNNSVLVRPKT